MDHMHPEFERLIIENAKLKASLKAADYEKQKMLELIQNLLATMNTVSGANENKPSYSADIKPMRDSNSHPQPSYTTKR